MAQARHMRGRGARLTIFRGGRQFPALDVDSWELKEVATLIADRVCGEDRDRLDKLINHYSLSLKCHNQTGDKIKSLMQYDSQIEAGAAEDVDGAIKLTDPKGGQLLLALRSAVIDDWAVTNGGQTEVVSTNIPIRGRYLEDLS